MGKLSTFKIVFSKNKEKYQPGDLVEGHVAIEIKDGIKVKGIYMECVGEASVGWSESQPTNSDKNRRNHIRYYKANETYFRYERELMKRTTERRGSISVNEGSYMYPFNFRLPTHIPSSFEGSLGHVRYWVSGTVEKNWGADHISKVDIKVTNPLDINLEKDARVSQADSSEAVLCCMCCRTGPITCEFRLDRTGYVPGEAINIKGEIINNSNRKVASTSARLMMHTEYHAEQKTKSHTVGVAEIKRGAIKAGGRELWDGDPLVVPPLPVSYLRGCSIISVAYWVELVVHPWGPAFDLKVPLRVIIGTIPLRKLGEAPPGPSGLCPFRRSSETAASPRRSLPASQFSSLPQHGSQFGKQLLPNVPEVSTDTPTSSQQDEHTGKSCPHTLSPIPASPRKETPAPLPSNNISSVTKHGGRSKRRVSCHQ